MAAEKIAMDDQARIALVTGASSCSGAATTRLLAAISQLTCLFLPGMKKRGRQHIINIGSVAGRGRGTLKRHRIFC